MLLTDGGEQLLAALEGWWLTHPRCLLLLVDHLRVRLAGPQTFWDADSIRPPT